MIWGWIVADRGRRRAVAAVLVGITTILVACGGIPNSGNVQAGDPFTEETVGDFVFNPLSPVKDADQRGILEGFIAAFYGTQGDYAVARQFLSSRFQKEWNPRKSVLIRSGSPTFSVVDAATMEYSFTTNAQVDEFGAYSTAVAATQRLQFQFVNEDGQWRISQAPPGIVLPESVFLRIFSKQALYFYDLSLQHLVPDERWFPGGTTATRIVSALLLGPPEWLGGAVVSQFPDGTQLTPGTAVTINSTVAQVDLTPEAASADERQRQLMQLQLSESLSTVPGIGSVEIAVAGSLLSIAPIGTDSLISQRAVDARPLVLLDNQFGYYSGGDVTPIEQLSDKVVKLVPRAATLGSLGTAAAVQNADGVYVVRTGQIPVRKVDERAGLIAPSIDDFGYVWSVPAGNPAGIMVYDFEGTAHPVAATMPVGATIVSLDVAQDNSRIAILLHTSAGARLLVAAIIRDPGQGYVPTSIGTSVLDTVADSATAIDATWVDRSSVATLTSDDGLSLVTSFEIGGQSTSLGHPDPSIGIVGGNGKSGLRVFGVDHFLQSPRGSSWQTTSTKVDMMATQH